MTKAELKSPQFLKILAPALRRLALFPKKSIGIVSFETNVELSHLVLWCKVFGRPTQADMSKLESGIVEDAPRAPAPRSEPQAKTVAPVLQAAKEPTHFELKFREACKLLLDHPELKEAAAAKRVGVLSGSWGYLKKKQFGLGPIAREKLAAYLGVPVPPPPPVVNLDTILDVDASTDDSKRGRLLVIVGGKKLVDLEIIVVGQGNFHESR